MDIIWNVAKRPRDEAVTMAITKQLRHLAYCACLLLTLRDNSRYLFTFSLTLQHLQHARRFSKTHHPWFCRNKWKTTHRQTSFSMIPVDESSIPAATAPPLQLVILIPAYNEEIRIVETLQSYRTYLDQSPLWRSRTTILVIDDGSTDGTSEIVHRIGSSSSSSSSSGSASVPIRCLSMMENEGKGAALAFGSTVVCKNYHPDSLIFTADADGSADIAGLDALYDSMVNLLLLQPSEDDNNDGNPSDSSSSSNSNSNSNSLWTDAAAVAVGYRTYQSTSASRLLFRWGFRTVVRLLCGDLGVRDSQCGCKLLPARTAATLYGNLNTKGWSYDVEVLYRAKKLGVPVTERAIQWEDKPGSKFVTSPFLIVNICAKMFWEVLRMRTAYETREWKAAPIPTVKKQ